MNKPTSFSDQISDAIGPDNRWKVIADAPAIALGNLYQATSQAMGNAAHNLTEAQVRAAITSQAATTRGIALIYGVEAATLESQGGEA